MNSNFLSPWYYINKNPGKNLRDLLIDGINVYIKTNDGAKNKIKSIIKDLHNASLLIDDIEDHSDTRRGISTAHIIYGIPLTINSANYIYFDCLKRLNDNKGATNVFITEMLNLHKGQGQELYWRDVGVHEGQLPSEQEYIDMVCGKTGGLFRMAVGLLLAYSSNDDAREYLDQLMKLSDNLAKYYQIRDDLINLTSGEYQDLKGYCEDLSEGKLSFPILYGIKKDVQLLEKIKEKPRDCERKKVIVERLNEVGAFEYTREYLKKVKKEIQVSMEELPKSEPLEGIIGYLFKD